MNEERYQAYLTLIESLLTCPSDEETAILQANIELLDDGFAQYLREWATQTLAEMESSQAENIIIPICNFSNLIQQFPLATKSSNMEIAIVGYEMALQVFNREIYAQNWAMTQNNLAAAYSDRIKEDRAENLEKAIAFYEAALQVRTRQAFPQYWARSQNNLAIAYTNRIKGDRGENIERAIAFYEAALQVYTRQAFPQYWAGSQNNLATAYLYRIKGDRGENIERAIAFYEAALQVLTPTSLPIDCLKTGRHLGNLGFAENL
jgi:tetratricopeptide (TPR) repeat protein